MSVFVTKVKNDGSPTVAEVTPTAKFAPSSRYEEIVARAKESAKADGDKYRNRLKGKSSAHRAALAL